MNVQPESKHMKTQKHHIVNRILGVLCALTALTVSGLYLWHHILLRKESKLLQARGYQFAQTACGEALSCLKTGNASAPHIIVTLAGRGENAFSVQCGPMTEYLKDDVLFVHIDRAGYGLSSDSDRKQTTAQIVDDYRSALKNMHIEPPYVLFAQTDGGVYAAYWESVFPDEIEGVFFLDGICLDAEDDSEYLLSVDREAAQFRRENSGILRLRECFHPTFLPENYSEAAQENARMLKIHSAMTAAQISEMQLSAPNRREAYQSLVCNQIPKAYLYTGFWNDSDFDMYDAWARSWHELPDYLADSKEITAENYINVTGSLERDYIRPYIERLGNCTLYELAGDSDVYMQKPMECAVLLSQFLAQLDQ